MLVMHSLAETGSRDPSLYYHTAGLFLSLVAIRKHIKMSLYIDKHGDVW